MEKEIYNVSGKVYKYIVTYPGAGTRYYVSKISKDGRRVGKPISWPSESLAIQSADKRAKSEGFT